MQLVLSLSQWAAAAGMVVFPFQVLSPARESAVAQLLSDLAVKGTVVGMALWLTLRLMAVSRHRVQMLWPFSPSRWVAAVGMAVSTFPGRSAVRGWEVEPSASDSGEVVVPARPAVWSLSPVMVIYGLRGPVLQDSLPSQWAAAAGMAVSA
ncbi:hypothetical protein GAH28_25660 [Salmonella enterica subsp. enterica serovar Java]|nr:hypothetical protein [Salmonella enterica subsp. enterica serovar Java]